MLILNAGFLTALGMLARIDEVTVAAHGLGLRIQSLAFVPGLSIAQATAAMVGQALGASNVARAREVVRGSMILCIAIMSALASARSSRPPNGRSVVGELANAIARDYLGIRGYTRRNLFRMRRFSRRTGATRKVSPLVPQLPWTHHLIILSQTKHKLEREFYLGCSRVRIHGRKLFNDFDLL